MVNEGIVLGHKISERGIEVYRAKVEAIEKMVMLVSIEGLLKTFRKLLGPLLIFFKNMFLLFLMMIARKPLKFLRKL